MYRGSSYLKMLDVDVAASEVVLRAGNVHDEAEVYRSPCLLSFLKMHWAGWPIKLCSARIGLQEWKTETCRENLGEAQDCKSQKLE